MESTEIWFIFYYMWLRNSAPPSLYSTLIYHKIKKLHFQKHMTITWLFSLPKTPAYLLDKTIQSSKHTNRVFFYLFIIVISFSLIFVERSHYLSHYANFLVISCSEGPSELFHIFLLGISEVVLSYTKLISYLGIDTFSFWMDCV